MSKMPLILLLLENHYTKPWKWYQSLSVLIHTYNIIILCNPNVGGGDISLIYGFEHMFQIKYLHDLFSYFGIFKTRSSN